MLILTGVNKNIGLDYTMKQVSLDQESPNLPEYEVNPENNIIVKL